MGAKQEDPQLIKASLATSRRGRLSSGAQNSTPSTFIGTSGWAYTSWKPGFYPRTVSTKHFLAHYATRLNTVEVNYTFRKLPTAKMLGSWLAASSSEFRFSFKAPQRLTHILRLKDCSQTISQFVQALAPVVSAGRMGVILFQLPPNFKVDVPRLRSFLIEAKKLKLRLAFEFRNSSWFCNETYTELRKYKAALCVAESDDLETPDIATAPFFCYRFRKRRYTRTQLATIEETLRRRSVEGEVFAYFMHTEKPTGARYAVDLLRRTALLEIEVATLYADNHHFS